MSLNVHVGRWTDWSKGSVLGDQITMSHNNANVLIAFIAIFVSLVGSASWGILAYIIHQSILTRKPRDGLYHQILVMLRNAFSPGIFAWTILSIGWTWRKRPIKHAILRAATFAGLAIFVWLLFAVAAITLSTIATTGPVLLIPDNCGSYNFSLVATKSKQISDEFNLALTAFSAEDYGQAYSYAEGCYIGPDFEATQQQEKQAPASDCEFYVQSALNWTTSFPSQCPFADKSICAGGAGDIVQFDTGFIDTNEHLGKNGPLRDRLLFRRITTCAPLILDEFAETTFVDDPVLGKVAIYNYGVNQVQPDLSPQSLSPNATFYYPYTSYVARNMPYELQLASTDIFGNSGEPAFTPDPRLVHNNASLTLIFLANRAIYLSPVTDPWFQAAEPLSMNFTEAVGGNGVQYYYNPTPGSVLGCVKEFTLCNPSLESREQCIPWPQAPLYGFGLAPDSITPLQLNEHRITLVDTVAGLLYDSDIWTILDVIGVRALTAPLYLETFGSLVSLPLPSTQWIAELQRLQAVAMAILQRDSFTDVTGPSDPRLTQFMDIDNTAWKCGIQKYRDSNYTSFSVLGLALIFGIGGLILVCGIVATIIVPSIQRRSKSIKAQFCLQQWDANHLLHLQKVVFADRGMGDWEGELDHVPTTKDGVHFSVIEDYGAHSGASPPQSIRQSEENKEELMMASEQTDEKVFSMLN